jgi:hypothetical protein
VAITRYRLYEIDTLINRTVAYLVFIGIVGGLFAGLLALFQRIFVIVNHRYREALPTVFTSNIGPKELAEQLGERTASRIIAMCKEGIELGGQDYRKSVERRKLKP